MPVVTRQDVRALEAAFNYGPASRSDLIAHAQFVRTSPYVAQVLAQLPYPLYQDTSEVWQDVLDLAAGGHPHPNPVGVCA
jgi:hypothetical protein